jgi:hypothetical protein
MANYCRAVTKSLRGTEPFIESLVKQDQDTRSGQYTGRKIQVREKIGHERTDMSGKDRI